MRDLPDNEILEAVQIEESMGCKKGKRIEGLDDYLVERVIGEGGFSKVYQVRHKNTGMMYAMKVVEKRKIKRERKVQQMMTERRILEEVDHPFVIKMHSAFQSVRPYIFIA